MAVIRQTRYQNIFSKRECLYLNFFPYEPLSSSSHTVINNPISYMKTDLQSMDQSVCRHYNITNDEKSKYIINRIKQHCAHAICPDEEVQWLHKTQTHELLFINDFIEKVFYSLVTNPYATNLEQTKRCHPIDIQYDEESLVTRIILLIDVCFSGTVEEKITLLNNARQKTQVVKGQISGVLTLSKKMPKELLSEFTPWICNYLTKFKQENSYFGDLGTFAPKTNKYALDKLLYNCMSMASNNKSLYDLFELKMKRAWAQKKHSLKNIEKVARNYEFSTETVKMLNELAKNRNISKTMLLESLVQETYKRYREE